MKSHNPYFSRWFSAMKKKGSFITSVKGVTILILVDGFLQFDIEALDCSIKQVTILILVDGFLQYLLSKIIITQKKSHNPYFSRWFSAILLTLF